jgi:phytoene dehydrogenase-like protein
VLEIILKVIHIEMCPILVWSNHKTPLGNLYLCGSGVHSGGGISGAVGRNVVKVLK